VKTTRLTFEPVTPKRWGDFELLFGERGACAGCWCMWFRGTRKDYVKNQGAGNKRRMKKIIMGGNVPGILAYHRGEPVGWCSIGPRETYDALERSRIMAPVDGRPVWSVTCLFVRKDFRRRGVSVSLLKAAARYAASSGARIVEGYPVEARKADEPDPFMYHGSASAFRTAGFKEVARRSPSRPVMRRAVRRSRKAPTKKGR
jgi:GNAT superfamily N-acetyltransferase